jgi:hypothetical protein
MTQSGAFVWITDNGPYHGQLGYVVGPLDWGVSIATYHPTERKTIHIAVKEEYIADLEPDELDFILLTMGRIASQVSLR